MVLELLLNIVKNTFKYHILIIKIITNSIHIII